VSLRFPGAQIGPDFRQMMSMPSMVMRFTPRPVTDRTRIEKVKRRQEGNVATSEKRGLSSIECIQYWIALLASFVLVCQARNSARSGPAQKPDSVTSACLLSTLVHSPSLLGSVLADKMG